MAEESNTEVFVYTEGSIVPKDVVYVRVHSSVTVIPDYVFQARKKLEEVELCDGLLEIGEETFDECKSLKKIDIPSTVTKIGEYAFFSGVITTFRMPPLTTTVSKSLLSCCYSVLSVEVPESVRLIKGYVFCRDIYLRNVAISHDTEVQDDAFIYCDDLLQLFDSEERIVYALKHRFDNLPIHKMIYYQSYDPVSVDQLNDVTDIRISQRRSKLNPTGRQQDCLGMTPLHIMACSTVQNIELYKVLVDKYPESLVTEDRWGAEPLLYAVWGDAPSEIVQFLVESYKSIHPNYELNWTNMVATLSIINSRDVIQKLLDIQQESFPEQSIDWNEVFDKMIANDSSNSNTTTVNETFKLLLKGSFSKRIYAIGVKAWRDDITNMIERTNCNKASRRPRANDVKSKLASYEAQYNQLKEATTILELNLWKKTINESMPNEQEGGKRKRKKTKVDELAIRDQSRVNCGADIIIENVLPYLAPMADRS